MNWSVDGWSPRFVAQAMANPEHPRHDRAKEIVRAYGKRWNTSTKRCPSSFYVCGELGCPGYYCAPGWCWSEERQLFHSETAADGCTTRGQARETAWMF